jgi:mono/diheme cytochrome c family protein
VARTWCSGCHVVDAGSGSTRDVPPSFAAVAQMPSTTALSLRAFLQTSHQNMPNWQLTPGQTDDVIAYILSLKGK